MSESDDWVRNNHTMIVTGQFVLHVLFATAFCSTPAVFFRCDYTNWNPVYLMKTEFNGNKWEEMKKKESCRAYSAELKSKFTNVNVAGGTSAKKKEKKHICSLCFLVKI